MKKIKLMAAALMLCAAGYFGYTAYNEATMSDAESMMLTNIDALTLDLNLEINPDLKTKCRCKSDGCYGGNAISFRPACASSLLDDCGANDGNCK